MPLATNTHFPYITYGKGRQNVVNLAMDGFALRISGKQTDGKQLRSQYSIIERCRSFKRLWPVFLMYWKEGLCPSRGDINRLMTMKKYIVDG
jgi:hypothetical protein